MSITGNKRKHEGKMAKKRQAKAARKSKYASLAGTSKKGKVQRRQSKKKGASSHKHAHLMANCGNAGCTRCNGIN